LQPEDAALYREIRREAHLHSPEAFSSIFEDEAARMLAWFADRLAQPAVFGAFGGGDLLGIVSFYTQGVGAEAATTTPIDNGGSPPRPAVRPGCHERRVWRRFRPLGCLGGNGSNPTLS
jgi:hypothetical protein